MAETDAPAMLTEVDDGENTYPALLGVTTYDPLVNPVKVKLPTLSVVAERVAVPDSVTVVEARFVFPEMLYVPPLGAL